MRRVGNNETRTITTTGGLITGYTWEGLDPARTYSFAVRAVNQVGRSTEVQSPAVRPLTDDPSIRFDSPAAGATVSGQVTVDDTAARNPSTRAPVNYVYLYVDGLPSTWTTLRHSTRLTWDTTFETDGPHTLRLDVYDTAFTWHRSSAM